MKDGGYKKFIECLTYVASTIFDGFQNSYSQIFHCPRHIFQLMSFM